MVKFPTATPNMTDMSTSKAPPAAALGELFSATFYAFNCGLGRYTSSKKCTGGRVMPCGDETEVGAYVPYGSGCIDVLDQYCL